MAVFCGMLKGMFWDWLSNHGSDLLGDIGIVAGLLFTGFGFRRDARVRHGETLIELTKQHRELWMYYDDHPELSGLFDRNRDMAAHPLTDEEVRFANFLFLHLRASYGAKKARIHTLPDHVAEDWAEIFAHPAIRAAWSKMKSLHDRRFVAVVEAYENQSRVRR